MNLQDKQLLEKFKIQIKEDKNLLLESIISKKLLKENLSVNFLQLIENEISSDGLNEAITIAYNAGFNNQIINESIIDTFKSILGKFKITPHKFKEMVIRGTAPLAIIKLMAPYLITIFLSLNSGSASAQQQQDFQKLDPSHKLEMIVKSPNFNKLDGSNGDDDNHNHDNNDKHDGGDDEEFGKKLGDLGKNVKYSHDNVGDKKDCIGFACDILSKMHNIPSDISKKGAVNISPDEYVKQLKSHNVTGIPEILIQHNMADKVADLEHAKVGDLVQYGSIHNDNGHETGHGHTGFITKILPDGTIKIGSARASTGGYNDTLELTKDDVAKLSQLSIARVITQHN